MNRAERRRLGVTNKDWLMEVAHGSPFKPGDRFIVPMFRINNRGQLEACELGEETEFVAVEQKVPGQLRIIAPLC